MLSRVEVTALEAEAMSAPVIPQLPLPRELTVHRGWSLSTSRRSRAGAGSGGGQSVGCGHGRGLSMSISSSWIRASIEARVMLDGACNRTAA